MAFNPLVHHRSSIRLHGYDYTQAGFYFITICVQDRACLFGEIIACESPDIIEMRESAPTRGAPTVVLNEAGKMVKQQWLLLPEWFPNIKLHEFVVMPNHFHGIVETVWAPLVGAHYVNQENSKHIGQIIGAFKSYTTNQYIKGVKIKGWPEFHKRLWQRNFWEHIIPTENAYLKISNYILNNPQNWQADSLNAAKIVTA